MYFFFFQAEDGIRDIGVTGVQTCALPICGSPFAARPESGVQSKQPNGTAVAGPGGGEQGEAKTKRSAVGVYPDGGRSIWLLGMLVTFKAVSQQTGGEYSLYELTVQIGRAHV